MNKKLKKYITIAIACYILYTLVHLSYTYGKDCTIRDKSSDAREMIDR